MKIRYILTIVIIVIVIIVVPLFVAVPKVLYIDEFKISRCIDITMPKGEGFYPYLYTRDNDLFIINLNIYHKNKIIYTANITNKSKHIPDSWKILNKNNKEDYQAYEIIENNKAWMIFNTKEKYKFCIKLKKKNNKSIFLKLQWLSKTLDF